MTRGEEAGVAVGGVQQSVERAQVDDLVMADPNPEVAVHTHTTATGYPANLRRPEIDWPCDFPTPHPAHEATAYDPFGILLGYTEHCHGGMGNRPGQSTSSGSQATS